MGNATSSSPPPSSQSAAPVVIRNSDTWKLFVCNAYLIPPFTVNKDNSTCVHQDERAAALGRVIVKSSPDVVLLQETWGAGQGALEKNLVANNFSIGKYCRSWFSSTVIDSVLQYANSRGGLYFSHNTATCVNANRASNDPNDALSWRSFSTSKTKSKKGMVCIKYQKKKVTDNSSKSSGTVIVDNNNTVGASSPSTLLVFNTHLDPTNQDNVQLEQLRDLGAFIRDLISQEAFSKSHSSSSSSTATNAPQPPNELTNADFAAVVVGDFNFTSQSSQYKEMWKIMERENGVVLTELLSPASQNTPTYSPKNPLVAWPDSAGRIDQIFGVASITFPHIYPRVTESASTVCQLKKVTLIQDQVRDDVVVSDHYPFEVTLQVS